MREQAAGRIPGPGLRALIDANAPLWAGEAEVFRTYWDWAGRTQASDLAWLSRQCFKELCDGFVAGLDRLGADVRQVERGRTRTEVLDLVEFLHEEYTHYCAFADAYDVIRRDEAPLDFDTLQRTGNWPENASLGACRARHVAEHGDIGRRAKSFTEGGYCRLFAEGMRLAGRGGGDDAIARACAHVFEDEWGHMLVGIAGLDDESLEPEGWALLRNLTVEQMRLRIRMRNAQFGFPLADERVRAIEAGHIEPVAFDYERAGFATPQT